MDKVLSVNRFSRKDAKAQRPRMGERSTLNVSRSTLKRSPEGGGCDAPVGYEAQRQ